MPSPSYKQADVFHKRLAAPGPDLVAMATRGCCEGAGQEEHTVPRRGLARQALPQLGTALKNTEVILREV